MGIIPTSSGSTRTGSITSWSYKIREENCSNIAIPFEKIYDILHDKKDTIKDLCNDLNLKAYFSVITHLKLGNTPLNGISNNILSFIVETNAELVFDMYCYNENGGV
jgi:hypothetical protein